MFLRYDKIVILIYGTQRNIYTRYIHTQVYVDL